MTADAAILGISVAVLLVALVSGRIERSLITGPMLVVTLGVLGSFLFDFELPMTGTVTLFLEITLALVLFSDASRIDLKALRDDYRWPQRMLLIGLPLAILLGAAAAALLLGLPVGLALLLGVILAPTDAALAEPVLVTDELPMRVRQTVNVESGLNDGLALPALFIAIALSGAEEGLSAADVVLPFVRQLGLGIIGGVFFGVIGAWLFGKGIASGWMGPAYHKIGIVALALAAFGGTELVQGSGFVASFLAGMIFAAKSRNTGPGLFEFAENESSSLVLVAFLMFGASEVRPLIENPPAIEIWALALVSLVVVRPVAVALSLIGRRLAVPTRLFFGWFGPRGLASIVFLLLALEELPEIPPDVFDAVIVTVTLSILLHGISAYPASMALARSLERSFDVSMPEMEEIHPHPMRVISDSRQNPD
ncbi:MAG: cation:proton antiporter [Actinobacteria bacterium]|nr:cation:proton antiporter [Actinomycetota bacterium]